MHEYGVFDIQRFTGTFSHAEAKALHNAISRRRWAATAPWRSLAAAFCTSDSSTKKTPAHEGVVFQSQDVEDSIIEPDKDGKIYIPAQGLRDRPNWKLSRPKSIDALVAFQVRRDPMRRAAERMSGGRG